MKKFDSFRAAVNEVLHSSFAVSQQVTEPTWLMESDITGERPVLFTPFSVIHEMKDVIQYYVTKFFDENSVSRYAFICEGEGSLFDSEEERYSPLVHVVVVSGEDDEGEAFIDVYKVEGKDGKKSLVPLAGVGTEPLFKGLFKVKRTLN